MSVDVNYGLQLLKDTTGEKFVVVSNKAYPKLQQKAQTIKRLIGLKISLINYSINY